MWRMLIMQNVITEYIHLDMGVHSWSYASLQEPNNEQIKSLQCPSWRSEPEGRDALKVASLCAIRHTQ